MIQFDYTVGCEAHKHFSLFAVLDEAGQLVQQIRVGHVPGAISGFLSQFPESTPVALETVGNGHIPAISGLVLPEGHRDGVDRRRDRSRWLHSFPGSRCQGQGHDGNH